MEAQAAPSVSSIATSPKLFGLFGLVQINGAFLVALKIHSVTFLLADLVSEGKLAALSKLLLYWGLAASRWHQCVIVPN